MSDKKKKRANRLKSITSPNLLDIDKGLTTPDKGINEDLQPYSYVDPETGVTIRRVVAYDWNAVPKYVTIVEPEEEELLHEAIYNSVPYIDAYYRVYGNNNCKRETVYTYVTDILTKPNVKLRLREKWDDYHEERENLAKWQLEDSARALRKIVIRGLGTLEYRFSGGVAREVTNAIKELNEMLGYYDKNNLEKRKLELEVEKLQKEVESGGATQQVYIISGEEEMRKALEERKAKEMESDKTDENPSESTGEGSK